MSTLNYHQELILKGLIAVEAEPSSEERARYLNAAADMLHDSGLSERCRVTARCLREAENAQLRLFNSIRENS